MLLRQCQHKRAREREREREIRFVSEKVCMREQHSRKKHEINVKTFIALQLKYY